ncbi:WhiB family transcriptional regulator [Rhodococcus sp. NPDC056506]|uniref:WhiB family transcriptional regulator n=1 Tax=Rhodococcus sp. NPDC056506 TaxID=3345844 RepID=UPI00366F9E41
MSFRQETWRNQAPCKGVDGFVREDGQEWPNASALTLCGSCPFIRECATTALTSGSTLDAIATTPADDVIAAGVVCAGDDRTARALTAVIEEREYKPRQSIPDNCKVCTRHLCSQKTAPDKYVAPHHSNGICTLCYQKHRYRQARTAGMPALF